jgi:O-antigen/teichoic acid export membrane protein
MICETVIRFTLSFFQAMQRMTIVAVTNVAVRVGWLVGSLAVMRMGGGVMELVNVRLLVTFVGLAASIALVQWVIKGIRWTWEPRFMWHILIASFPFALFRLFGQVYTDIDTVMLSAMRGDTATGLYAAGQKILRVFGFIQSGFFNAVLPALARFSKDSKDDMGRAMARSCRYLVMIALPISGGICVLADRIVLLFYGPEFAGAIPAMRVLIWSLAFTFLNSAMVASIASVRQEKKASKYLLAGCLFSGLSNLVVVPLWGHVGAAITTVLAEAFVFLLQLRLLATAVPNLDVLSQFGRPLIAGALMMATTWLLNGFGLAVSIGGSALVYVGALFALGLIGPEERAVARQLLKWKPAGQTT